MRHAQRTRKGQRGSVMVESLIVIAMMTIMLAVGLFLHAAYAYKVAAMRTAREQAWQTAERGCGGGLTGGLVGDIVALIQLCQGSAVQAGSPGFSIGASTSAQSNSVTAPALIGGRTFTMTAETRVACNEVNPPFSDIAGMCQWGFSELVPSF